jgi:hypothetical protein
MSSNATPHTLPGPIALLKEAWQLTRSRYQQLFTLAIIPNLFFLGMGIVQYFRTEPTQYFTQPGPIILINLALWLVVYVAMIHMLHDKKLGVKPALEHAVRRAWPVLVTYLTVFSVLFGSALMFYIPVFIVIVWSLCTLFVLEFEHESGLRALLISREYARNHFWQIVWRYIVWAFTVGLVGTVITLVSLMISFRSSAGTLGIEDVRLVSFGLSMVHLAFTGLLMPLQVALNYVLYSHLKKIRGAFQLSPTSKTRTFFKVARVLGVPVLLMYAWIMGYMFTPAYQAQVTESQLMMKKSHQKLIHNELQIYYKGHGYYPQELNDITSRGAAFAFFTKDPATNQPYQYHPTDQGQDFELCIQFADKGKECTTAESEIDGSP